MQTRLKNIFVSPDATILEAIQAINNGARQIALVVDEHQRLLGSVTDGDVRRGLLRGVGLDQPVSLVMQTQPATVLGRGGWAGAVELMRRLSIHQVPVVDEGGRVIGLECLDEVVKPAEQDTWVVLMVGGLGTRLRPLTESVPKPMLPIGGRPLLESILRALISQGYRRFFLSVNYMSEVFQDYFGDGSRLGAQIEYLVEDSRLGTAGALALLPGRPSGPLIVMNGDLLTAVNFQQLLTFHCENQAVATMCTREYLHQVPYGVVQSEGANLLKIEEKPEYRYFINAGIYVINPEVLDLIPPGEFFDMPQLFDRVLAEGDKAVVYPIREYWLDIGRLEDLKRAQSEFEQVFGE